MVIYNKETGEIVAVVKDEEGDQMLNVEVDGLNSGLATSNVLEADFSFSEESKKIEEMRKKTLHRVYMDYQLDGRIDSNLFGTLMAIKASGNVGVKAQSCLDWLDKLWTPYHVDVAMGVKEASANWEEIGAPQFGFTEIRAEFES